MTTVMHSAQRDVKLMGPCLGSTCLSSPYARRTCNRCRNASQLMLQVCGVTSMLSQPHSPLAEVDNVPSCLNRQVMLVSATCGSCGRMLIAGSSTSIFTFRERLHCTPTGCSDASTPRSLSPGTAHITERCSCAKDASPFLHSSAAPRAVCRNYYSTLPHSTRKQRQRGLMSTTREGARHPRRPDAMLRWKPHTQKGLVETDRQTLDSW
jgi:hypothetical protein